MNGCAISTETTGTAIAHSAAPIVSLSLDAAKPAFATYFSRVRAMKREAAAIRITDEASLAAAVSLGGEAKRLARLLAEQEEKVTRSAAARIRAIRNFVGLFTRALVWNGGKTNTRCVEAVLKRKIGEYRRRTEASRKREEVAARKRQGCAEGATGETSLSEPVPSQRTETVIRTEAGTLGYQVRMWKAHITVPDEVPREYCSPDMRKINEAAKSGIRKIPGIRIYEETSTRFRA